LAVMEFQKKKCSRYLIPTVEDTLCVSICTLEGVDQKLTEQMLQVNHLREELQMLTNSKSIAIITVDGRPG
jgi:hypothetical protein